MLAHRIIPTLLYRGTTLVKGERFRSWRSIGHVLQAAEIYAARNCDELIFLDIGATGGPNLALVEQISAKSFSPITIGGGVRTLDHVRDLLRAGADKVALCTALTLPDGMELLRACADTLGSQALVAAIDYLPDRSVDSYGASMRTTHEAVSFAQECAFNGAGEILLTSVAREGTMDGYDLETIERCAAQLEVPLIAHGGCGTPQHMAEALRAGASAVAAGAMFAFTDTTPADCARALTQDGLEVRCA